MSKPRNKSVFFVWPGHDVDLLLKETNKHKSFWMLDAECWVRMTIIHNCFKKMLFPLYLFSVVEYAVLEQKAKTREKDLCGQVQPIGKLYQSELNLCSLVSVFLLPGNSSQSKSSPQGQWIIPGLVSVSSTNGSARITADWKPLQITQTIWMDPLF